MIWTAWKSGKFSAISASYGFKVSLKDRREFFDADWSTVTVQLPTAQGAQTTVAGIKKKSFWTPTCGELITPEIRDWLFSMGHVAWPMSKPPKFEVVADGPARFRVIGLKSRS